MRKTSRCLAAVLAALTVLPAAGHAEEASVASERLLDVTILGGTTRVPLQPGKALHLAKTVHFAYAGPCFTSSDFAELRAGVLTGHDAATVSNAVDARATSRHAHRPAKAESVTLESGAWAYDLVVTPSVEPDGVVTVAVTGEVAGPSNYNADAAQLCNGYHPVFGSAKVSDATATFSTVGRLELPLVGQVQLKVSDVMAPARANKRSS